MPWSRPNENTEADDFLLVSATREFAWSRRITSSLVMPRRSFRLKWIVCMYWVLSFSAEE